MKLFSALVRPSRMSLVCLGTVQRCAAVWLIKTNPGDRVLEIDTKLFLADNTEAGVVADIVGTIEAPFYVLAVHEGKTLQETSSLYYKPGESLYVDVEGLKADKGTDMDGQEEQAGAEDSEESS